MSTDRKVNEFVVPSKPGLNGKTIFIPFGQKEGTTEVEGKLSAWLQRFVNNRISNLNGEPNQGRLEITGVTAFEIFDQLERDHLVIDKLFMIFFNRKFPNKEDLFPFAGLEIDPSGKVNNRSLATQVLSNVRPLEEEDNLKDKYIGVIQKLRAVDEYDYSKIYYLMISSNGHDKNSASVITFDKGRLFNFWSIKTKTLDMRKIHPSSIVKLINEVCRKTIKNDNGNFLGSLGQSLAKLGTPGIQDTQLKKNR